MTQGGIKHDQDKSRLDLLPPIGILEVGRVLGYGAKKYTENGWRTVTPSSRYLSAALRHIMAILNGEEIDPESGLPHAAHAACSMLFYAEMEHTNDR